jgi:hypothetical protein
MPTWKDKANRLLDKLAEPIPGIDGPDSDVPAFDRTMRQSDLRTLKETSKKDPIMKIRLSELKKIVQKEVKTLAEARSKAEPVRVAVGLTDEDAGLWDQALRKAKIKGLTKFVTNNNGSVDIVTKMWGTSTQREHDRLAKGMLKDIAPEVQKLRDTQKKAPKINDDDMLEMLGAAFTMTKLEPHEVKWINYKVVKNGIKMTDRMDDRGIFPLGHMVTDMNLDWIEDYMGAGVTPQMVGSWLRANGAQAVTRFSHGY